MSKQTERELEISRLEGRLLLLKIDATREEIQRLEGRLELLKRMRDNKDAGWGILRLGGPSYDAKSHTKRQVKRK